MAVEDHEGTLVITGSHIEIYAVLSLKMRLKMELRGLRGPAGPSALQQLKNRGIVPASCRNKAKALEYVEAWLTERKPQSS